MRLFIAIMAPNSAHGQISRAAEPLLGRMGVKILPPDNWHLTLRFMGEVREDGAKKIAGALSSVRFQPFAVRLFGAGAYPNASFPRAIFVGGESKGAEALAAEIDAALSPFGIRKEKFSFHLTIARSKGAGDIGEFLARTGEVCEFEARSFFLMRSRLLPGGAAYEVLREYPAQG